MKQPKGLPELMTVEQVASWLHVSEKALYQMVERGEIPASAVYRIGRRMRFDAAALHEWIQASRRTP